MKTIPSIFFLVLLWGLVPQGQPAAAEGERFFFYLSDQRIITVELISEKKAILNYINLSDAFELIEASGLLVLDAEGRGYRGHVILNEEPSDNRPARYFVSDLIKPRAYRGYDILGNFRYQAPAREVYLRLGARIAELEPVSAQDFDLIAIKVGDLNLDEPNTRMAVVDAGFWQGQGDLHHPGSEKFSRLEKYLSETDPVPPILLSSPAPRLAGQFPDLPDPLVVRLRAKITAEGGVVGLEVIEGINSQLDEQAIETVRNSWEFLPAISQGEPADAELVLRVFFER